jgi:hypothetical protein
MDAPDVKSLKPALALLAVLVLLAALGVALWVLPAASGDICPDDPFLLADLSLYHGAWLAALSCPLALLGGLFVAPTLLLCAPEPELKLHRGGLAPPPPRCL